MKPQPIVLFYGDFLMQEDGPKQRVTRTRVDAGDSGILMRGVLKCQANIWSQKLGSGEINGYCTDPKMPQEVRRACIAINHEFRLLSLWGRVKQLADDGLVGEPRYVLVELSWNSYCPGSDGWRFDISRVGNRILEGPIHFFGLARWYLSSVGELESVCAAANSRRPGHPEL